MFRTLTLLCISHVCFGQRYFIGDMLEPAEPLQIEIKPITKTNLVIEEPEFTVRFNKDSVLAELQKQSINLESDWKIHLTRTIDYLKSEEKTVLKNLWIDCLKSDTVSIYDEHLSQLAISMRVLRESLCGQIETGNFQLILKGNQIMQF